MDLRFSRMRLGLTQCEIAERIGVHQSTVAWWEAGKTAPSIKLIPVVAREYGVDLDDLTLYALQKKRTKKGGSVQ